MNSAWILSCIISLFFFQAFDWIWSEQWKKKDKDLWERKNWKPEQDKNILEDDIQGDKRMAGGIQGRIFY